MTLAQVAAAIGVAGAGRAVDVVVRSVEFDTRRVTPGRAVRGAARERADGHAFAAAAAAAGAVAVLGSRADRAGRPAAAAGSTTGAGDPNAARAGRAGALAHGLGHRAGPRPRPARSSG